MFDTNIIQLIDWLWMVALYPYLQQEPSLEPSCAPAAVRRVPPVAAPPAPSPSFGNFFAIARKMSFTLRAV